MIQERTKNYRDYSDLFSNLIAANENDSEGLRLTDQEMVGNVFIFLLGKSQEPFIRSRSDQLIAGHETTADVMAFTFGLLALYPDVQEKLYSYVVEMVADPTGAPVSVT
jgi:cytochrome P450